MINEIVSAVCFFLPSFVSRQLFLLLGHKIGKNARLPVLSYIFADKIKIGNDVDIRPMVFIRVHKLSVGNNSIISFGSLIKGDKNFTTKGSNFIGAFCLINCEENVTFGFYSGIGPKSTIYTHGSFLPVTMGYPAKFEEVVLEDYVWVAMAVTILPGVHIESNCIINPGVTLNSKVKANTLIECAPTAVTKKSLNRLLIFSKNTNKTHLENIISDFLTYYRIHHTHDKVTNSFSVKKKYTFRYTQETNKIELIFDSNKSVLYDFDNFYTGCSNLKIHKQFLFFLRRRLGVILQTEYNN